ncbi:MAG: helix-turn-helix transcriptional regulator [Saprospiraceae bacterium]|nr:helix-turn-helix transcriptional regulator [Saprospiraceae bacterium]
MNKEKIKNKIIQSATKNTEWLKEAKWRQENRDWLDMSGRIALKVLRYLRKEKITQKALAEQLGWSPQYLNKILKGSENLTLETICKLQTATGLVLIEVPKFEYEKELV